MPRRNLQSKKDADARYAFAISARGRDIGAIADIADRGRREQCRLSLKLFCETYNQDAFHLGWSTCHLRAIQRLEEAALLGALYAFAMPRGTGKTILCRMAALWAISYRHCCYAYMIGANAAKAEDAILALKTWMRYLPVYAEDFPEIAQPIRALGGIAHRASGQICQGESTLVEWAKDRIVLPTVPPPSNWPASWPLRDDGRVPTSGSVVSASGLTGDGIRGSLLTLSTGQTIRPDLVLLDDPQTNESAHSPTQNATREQLVGADVLGMAGPGKSLSAVMPCTVIAQGDFVDRILDRGKHPLWRGERTKLLPQMPIDLAAWDSYFDVYYRCAQKEPPNYEEANQYYLAHREALDRGAEASWEERKLPTEISAVQHAMHLYARDRRAFWAEYQNAPLPIVQAAAPDLTADQVAQKTNGLARGVVPQWATLLTLGVDVQKDLFFWVLCGWDASFTGHIVDYGTYPEQSRTYFALRDVAPNLATATGVPGLEPQIFKGLTQLANGLLRVYSREDGQEMRCEKVLIDANWQTETVKQWCRQCGRAEVLPAHGRFFGATHSPMSEWKTKPGEQRGLHWVRSKHLLFDTNFWKSFLLARWQTPQPARGGLTLWGRDPSAHRLFADHITAESHSQVTARGRTIDVWQLIPGRENHWLDALALACVAASVAGCKLGGLPLETVTPQKTISFAELQKKAKQERLAKTQK